MIQEHHTQQLNNDLYVANALLGEVVSATYVDSSILLENDDFRSLLSKSVRCSEMPFNELSSSLIKFVNDNF
jgi:hypothetical protein